MTPAAKPAVIKPKVKFPCGNCAKTTSGAGSLQCTICDYWHHKKCIPGMTDAYFDMVLHMKESMGSHCWLCEKCQHATKKLHKEVIVVAKRLDKVETDVLANKSAADNNKSEIDLLKARLLKVESTNGARTDGTKTAVLAELQQLDDKKSNAVIYGLCESDSTDAETRKTKDLDLIRDIAVIMGLHLDKWFGTISVCRRLGKLEPNKSRPLLVSFNDPGARDAFMSNARFLARSQMDHISIKPDLTKDQQQVDLKLREEAKRLNLERPHDEHGHFLWKVIGCPGQPSRRLVKSYPPLQGANRFPIPKPRPAITHQPSNHQTPPTKTSVGALANKEIENDGWTEVNPSNNRGQKRMSSSQQPGSPSRAPLLNKPRHSSPTTNHDDKSPASDRNARSPGRNFNVLSQD